jgi:hypothetical protein
MRLTSTLTIFTALSLLACKPSGGDGDAGATGSSESGADESLGMGVTSATASDPSTPTLPPTTTAPSTEPPGTASSVSISEVSSDPTVPTVPTSFTSDDTFGSFTDSFPCAVETAGCTNSDGGFTTESLCGDPEFQPQDATCTDPSGCGCASGRCFLVPILGGWCGECLVDEDCPGGGCTVPNPIASVGAVCNMGEAGAGCMSADACTDAAFPACATVLDIPGIITVSTCSQCDANADCPPDAPNCTPVYDIGDFSGVKECRPDNSVPNDEGCSLTEDPMGQPEGNAACQSGFCGEADIMGLLKMGICGECNVDSDCPQGQSCTAPQVDLNSATLTGSVCL